MTEKGTLVHSRICVIGEGSWGTAIASLLANNGYNVNLWCHNPKIAESINKNHLNEFYFPEYKLNEKIKAEVELSQALNNVEWVFEAIPVKYLRNILIQSKSYFKTNQNWVILSKGLEKDTSLFPSQILDDVFCANVNKAILSGPSFANDLMEKKLTAVNIGSDNGSLKNALKTILENDYFKIRFCNDLIGMQVSGALKNIVAIIIGIVNAKNFSDNTKAFIFTQCIDEMKTLIKYFGGNEEALLELCGIGDLILTCFGKHSKNLKLGIELGSAKSAMDVLNKISVVPEGINTIGSIYKLSQINNLKIPMFEALYKFVFQGSNFDQSVLEV